MNRPLLVDVSHWQTYTGTDYGFNFLKARDQGVVGAMIRAGSCRASDGYCYEDYDLKPNVQMINTMDNFPRWYYWYMRPKWGGKRQALAFINYLKANGVEDNFVGLVGDFEVSELNAKDTVSEWDQFMEVLRYHYPDKKHMIYSGAWKWNSIVKRLPASASAWAKFYDLWIPIYPNDVTKYTHPWQNTKYKPVTWDDWTFWQYTDKGDGKRYGADSHGLDMNWFNGTLKEFYAYCSLEEPVSPPGETPPPAEIHEPIFRGVVTANVLNMRNTPSTANKPLGGLLRGAEIPLYGIDGQWGMVTDKIWVHMNYVRKI